ncbi:hypothetical protein ACFL2E_06210 [Thermodesulfobacteriota bacterium]
MATKEELINAAKRADKKTDRPLSQSDFIKITGFREWQIENLFTEGGWSELKRLAKIESQPMRSKTLSGKKAITKKKKITKEEAIAQEDVITEFDSLELTDTKSNQEIIQPPINPPTQSKKGMEEMIKVEIAEFGELINFRGLRHAPINENGVIYLFGMVSHEIGFMVEAVHAAFPDCEAKRHIGENRYQRVRIKFEYKSSNFKSHGYDLAGADMIVCWIHDWPDCPLEVLELRSAIEKLES